MLIWFYYREYNKPYKELQSKINKILDPSQSQIQSFCIPGLVKNLIYDNMELFELKLHTSKCNYRMY